MLEKIFNREISLGKVYGIEIALDYSWFWVFLLVTFSFAYSLLPRLITDQSALFYLVYGLTGSLLFFLSIIIHELGHTLVAKRNNLEIKKITLFLFGGASNLTDEPPNAAAEFKMAVAGPLFSIIIGSIFIAIAAIINLFKPNVSILPLVFALGSINYGLAIFNLLPGFPLDGGRVLRSLIWWRTDDLLLSTRISSNFGKVLAVALILYGFWQIIVSGSFGGFWLILVGFFLYQTAGNSYLQTLAILVLRKAKVGDIPKHSITEANADTPLSSFSQKSLSRHDYYLVRSGSDMVGIFDGSSLQQIPQSKWRLPVSDVSTPLDRFGSVAINQPAIKAMQILAENKTGMVPVQDETQEIIGIITYDDLRNFLLNRTD